MKIKNIMSGGENSLFFPKSSSAVKEAVDILNKAPVQAQPLIVKDSADREFKVFIDAVSRDQDRVIVLGWSTHPGITLTLLQEGQPCAAKVTRHARGDVAQSLGLSSGDSLGFSLVSQKSSEIISPELQFQIPHAPPYKTGPLDVAKALSKSLQALVPEMLEGKLEALHRADMGSEAWRKALAALPDAREIPSGLHGFVEGIFVSPLGNGVVYGWALHPEDALIWLEDEMQNTYPLSQAFRRERKDISLAFPHELWSDMEAAFVLYLPEVSKNPFIRLRTVTEQGVITISERASAEMLPSDPRAAAEQLFAVETEERAYHRRAKIIDWQILEPLIKKSCEELELLTPEVNTFGAPMPNPDISVIVPLYKRYDFMEHQVLEFIRDPFFRDAAELIYVVDDPEIRMAVLAEAQKLFHLYQMPMRVVSGRRNRGFSGANNLGATHAHGAYFLFLNSDVIPISPGWLEGMLDTLRSENVGAVGAQLLFADGGIQHVGMNFEYLDEFYIWSNQHTDMGMPAYGTDREAFEVPAVTGACVLVPKSIFLEINGWDTGYLVGDFEDSHLCFAIRDAGYRILCQPASILTHLERQSFTGIGSNAFRSRMTICNAVRHQGIWNHVLGAQALTEITS